MGAEVSDPVVAYRAAIDPSQPGEHVLKWQADVNGDGHKEVFLTYKHAYDEDKRIEDMTGWTVYLSNAAGTAYAADVETHEGDEISYGPMKIDVDRCFVGEISEIGGKGLLTQEIVNPRDGGPIARIYAYKITDGHLEVSKLAEYNAKEENALFNKYLAEGKRTVITPVEVAP